MKKTLLFSIGLLISFNSFSQAVGNEWINYSQEYFKFDVAATGVYRITGQQLLNAGILISDIDPAQIQVFARGEEIPIYISDVDPNQLNTFDVIEFVGYGNDGSFESSLYESESDQANPKYSLFNDTIHYFLTINPEPIGKRYEQGQQFFEPYTPQPFVWYKSEIIYGNAYHHQPLLLEVAPFGNPNLRVSLSEYVRGEGWMGSPFGFRPGTSLTNPRLVPIPTPSAYVEIDAPNAEVYTRVVGVSDMRQDGTDHSLTITAGNFDLTTDFRYDGYDINTFEGSIPTSELGQTTTISHTGNVSGSNRDEQAVSDAHILYPRIPDLDGIEALSFLYRENPGQDSLMFRFNNASGTNPRIYTEGSNGQRIELTVSDGFHLGLIGNQPNQSEFACHLVTDQSVISVGEIEPVGNGGIFTQINTNNAPSDSVFIIVSHNALIDAASAYESYRQGDDLSARLFDVDEIYDQFGHGVEKSGVALRNFSSHIIDQWPTSSYLLLLGKSIRAATVGGLGGYRRSGTSNRFEQCLVPSLGYPPSDNLITSGLADPNSLEPTLKTGRISAQSSQEAFWYLDKLQTFEGDEQALWKKNVMHFGGGNNAEEQQRFAGYLEGYETIIEGMNFGANVNTYLKTSSEPVQINTNEEISQLIEEEGVAMMTFFAHAGGEGFDQTIDDPQNFNWNGKYPFLLANGCYSGDYHSQGNGSVSESFTLLNAKGTIGFLASVELGFEGDLNGFSNEFYKQLSQENYGNSVGDHIKKTIKNVQGTQTILRKYLVLGMGLQGDPAVVVHSYPKPDLAVTNQDVFFTPDDITADVDSFTVNVVVSNIARGTEQNFSVTLEHQTPQGIGDSTYTVIQNGLLYRDTVQFKVGIDPQFGLGLHSFDVSVDWPQNEVEELPGFETSNNQVLGKELFISNGGIVPIYPYKYAVVPQKGVNLVASTGDPLSDEETYRIEIDTTDTYNSPLLQTTEIAQIGGLVEWSPNLNYSDSIVYFWRARELDSEEVVWRESSFQYIPDQQGWGQDNFFQLKNNSFSSTEFNRPDRRLDFFTGNVTLRNTVIGNSYSDETIIVLNTNQIEYGACLNNPAIHLAVLDPVTFEAWGTDYGEENPENNFGNDNTGDRVPPCRPRVEYFFIFRQGVTTQLQDLAKLLLSETIPDGHYVVLYTVGGVSYAGWPSGLREAFGNLNAETIGSEDAQNGVPFSLITRKGDPNFVFEEYGESSSDILNNVVLLPASGRAGQVSSSRIGPASDWGTASWKLSSTDKTEGDETLIKILGTNSQGLEAEIAGLVFTEAQGEVDLSEIVPANEFPQLRFVAELRDTVNTTPAQIDRWHVLYDKVPEAAVDPSAHFEFKGEELNRGEEGYLSVAITNVSDIDMDSLLVHYWIEDNERNRIDLTYPRQDSLRAGQTLIDTVFFETLNLSGRNILWVEVNPRIDASGNFDQPEQTHFNNFLQIPFEINTDNENPILDVTFDGVRIINGEIVSPRPQILIALKDENPFLLMDEPSDTSLFRIFVSQPDADFEQIYFNSGTQPVMEFVPATDNKNRAKILFNPQFTKDGDYRLLVQATDKSNNAAGNVDYVIDFEVINQSTISEVLNYPNPFSTSTRFVFTVTGAEVPDEFKIQIMTISGKVVKEILQDEIGPIRIGRNITQYAWDGRDEFGDRLANGVYLYRVFARLNGEDIANRDNGGAQYFTKSFGKMVLFR